MGRLLGAVAVVHPLASLVGHDVLGDGGNAFDLPVAISTVVSVGEPHMMIVREPLGVLFAPPIRVAMGPRWCFSEGDRARMADRSPGSEPVHG
jgi:hypothetical protein